MNNLKKQNGVFYTDLKNPFKHKRFMEWASQANIREKTILEPFAGANHIIKLLKSLNLCNDFNSFDINPKDSQVNQMDTLLTFPKGHEICITNPAWLYKSRASRLKLDYPKTQWDNLYKYSLDRCLQNCDYVAILIPASFLNSDIFLERLYSVVIIQDKLFTDTDNPVCLAMFNKENTSDTDIFIDDVYIGKSSNLKRYLPTKINPAIRFNIKDGDLGLIAVDNTKEASIRFCKSNDLGNYEVKNSSRSITKLSIDGVNTNMKLIRKLNNHLKDIRANTHDIFMTPFKGMRVDGMYRRRLDYSLARKLVSENL